MEKKEWAIVVNAGTDDETVDCFLKTMDEACKKLCAYAEESMAQVMKLVNGRLTTEY